MSGWGVFCVVIGGLSGACALLLLALDLMRYRKATGIIIGNASHTGDTVEMYAPTVRFRTDDGVDRTFQSICYFSSSPYPEGEPIPVRYHPTIARLNGINKIVHRFFGVVLFGIFAAAFIWLGVILQNTDPVQNGEVGDLNSYTGVVHDIASKLDAESKERLRNMNKSELSSLHHGWGTAIRNEYGFWNNAELIASCERAAGKSHIHPDDASMVVIEGVWEMVNSEGD